MANWHERRRIRRAAAAYRGQDQALGQGREIQPGYLILTGALGKITPAEPGDWTADFGELGKIEFSIH